MLTIRCPNCGSNDLRSSPCRTAWETIQRVFGYVHVRCRECERRFGFGLLGVVNLPFARCPQCYRLELSQWRPEQYQVGWWWSTLLAFGAKPHRCEACRRNFVSFRRCKVRYRRRKTANVDGGRMQPFASSPLE